MDVDFIHDYLSKQSYWAKDRSKELTELPELRKENGIGLRTKDAHSLYENYGFKNIDNPETWMLNKQD